LRQRKKGPGDSLTLPLNPSRHNYRLFEARYHGSDHRGKICDP